MRLQVEEVISQERVAEVVVAMVDKKMTKSAAIKELFAGGLEVKDIATATGIRYNHVYNVVNNEVLVHGLEVIKDGRGSTNSKKNQILEGLEAGKSITEIAREQKCLYNYVWQVAKAAGYTGKKKEVEEKEVEEKKEEKVEVKKTRTRSKKVTEEVKAC